MGYDFFRHLRRTTHGALTEGVKMQLPGGEELLKVMKDGDHTKIYGGETTDHDLWFNANQIDVYPNVRCLNNGDFQLKSTAAVYILIDANEDIKLLPFRNVSFGTYAAGAATDSTGYIEIRDAAGTLRKLMVQA